MAYALEPATEEWYRSRFPGFPEYAYKIFVDFSNNNGKIRTIDPIIEQEETNISYYVCSECGKKERETLSEGEPGGLRGHKQSDVQSEIPHQNTCEPLRVDFHDLDAIPDTTDVSL